jgi:hypothetical protein
MTISNGIRNNRIFALLVFLLGFQVWLIEKRRADD